MPVSGSGVILGAKMLAERRFDRPAAGEVMAAAGQRVAGGAIADDREIAAALDLIEILFVDAGRLRGAGRSAQCRAEQ